MGKERTGPCRRSIRATVLNKVGSGWQAAPYIILSFHRTSQGNVSRSVVALEGVSPE
jgi:hypothetical protein